MLRMLGKLPAKADHRRLMLGVYGAPLLPAPPEKCDRTYGIAEWGNMGNSGVPGPPPAVRICGDCAYAAVGHHIMAWSMGATHSPVILSDQVVVDAYATGTGYNPTTGAGDNGSSMIAVQEQWRTVGIGGNKIAAYAGVDLRNPVQAKQTIFYFGGLYAGLTMPQSAMEQAEANLLWSVPWFSPIVGGHAIPILSYTTEYLWAITWGKVQAMTWEFFTKYCEEGWAVVDPLWIGANELSPSMLNLAGLIADLAAVNARAGAPPMDQEYHE